jgi:hypothetical protein
MWHPLIASRRQIAIVITMAAVAVGSPLSEAPPNDAPPGWQLVWSDDFDSFDDEMWQPTTKPQSINGEKQAYLPQQVSVHDGKLVILSERSDRSPFRSGQVISKRAQRLGRWEIRAKIPTVSPVEILRPSISLKRSCQTFNSADSPCERVNPTLYRGTAAGGRPTGRLSCV